MTQRPAVLEEGGIEERMERGWRGEWDPDADANGPKEGREEGNIDLRQENGVSSKGPILFSCANRNQKWGGGSRKSCGADLCCFTCVYPPMTEEDTPKEREEDAVIRCLQWCREAETGSGREGVDYATLIKKRWLFGQERAFHLEIPWECGGRLIKPTIWRCPETSRGVGHFDRREAAAGQGVDS